MKVVGTVSRVSGTPNALTAAVNAARQAAGDGEVERLTAALAGLPVTERLLATIVFGALYPALAAAPAMGLEREVTALDASLKNVFNRWR